MTSATIFFIFEIYFVVMKKIILIFLIQSSLLAFGQNPELFTNTWYLQNTIIDGQDNIPPVSEVIPYITADFIETDYGFQTSICNGLSGSLIYGEEPAAYFQFIDVAITLGSCMNSPGFEGFDEYEAVYFQNYWESSLNGNAHFYYLVDSAASIKTLTITNINGDQAIYNNTYLTNEENLLETYSIFPNPVKDRIFVAGINIKGLTLFNFLGQKINTTNENEMDVSNYKKGIYLLEIKTKNNHKMTKKIIISN